MYFGHIVSEAIKGLILKITKCRIDRKISSVKEQVVKEILV